MPNYQTGVYRNFNHSRAKAIRAQCLECSGDNASEVRKCTAKGCALWAFRMGYEVDADGNKRVFPPKPQISGDLAADFDVDCEDDEILVCEDEGEIDSKNGV